MSETLGARSPNRSRHNKLDSMEYEGRQPADAVLTDNKDSVGSPVNEQHSSRNRHRKLVPTLL